MIMYSGCKIKMKKTYVIHILHKLNKLAKNPRLVDFSSLVIDLDLGIESCCSSNVECWLSGKDVGDVGELHNEKIFPSYSVSLFLGWRR